MTNAYFTPTGSPATSSRGVSANIRSEVSAIEAGFDKLPTPAQLWGHSGNYATAGGSTDAWTASIATAYLTSYVDGMQIRVKFGAANTVTAPTINLNTLGNKVIATETGGALGVGDIAAGMIGTLTYNSTSGKFHMTATAVANGAAAAASASAAASSATAAAASATAAATSATASASSATTAQAAAVEAQTIISPVSVVDYTALRAYAGVATTLNVTGYLVTAAPQGIAGTFTRDDSDTTSADNGGTIIVASNGKRWKRVFDGPVSIQWFGVKGDGATDDTSLINSAISTVSAAAVAAGRRIHLWWPDGIYMTSGILVKKYLWLDFGNAYIKRNANGGSTNTNCLLRAVETLSGSTYYGTYSNIKITGGTFDSNGYTVTAQVVRLQYLEDSEIHDVKVIHGGSNAPVWAFCIGGRRLDISGLRINDGAELFQDGVHITHGQHINISGIYAESGDDALAIGGEPTDPYLGADPDPIRYVTVNGVNVKSKKAHAVAVYVQSGASGTNWEVSDVEINGVVGTAGELRNGAILIHDRNNGAYGTTQIRRVQISGLSLGVGSTTHDEVNSVGVEVRSAEDVKVSGSMKFTDKTGAVTGFRVGVVDKSENVVVDLTVPAIPKNGGVQFTSSRGVKLRGTLRGAAAQAQSSVLLNDAEDALVDATLLNVPTGINVVALTGGTLTALNLGRSKLGHAAGAASGYGLDTTAALFTHLEAIGVDFSACFSPFASGSIPSGTSFTFAHNKGAQTRKTGATGVAAGSTSVTVTHGCALQTTNLSQISITPSGTLGAAASYWIGNLTGTTFDVITNAAPGGAGFNFRWAVDTGRTPV